MEDEADSIERLYDTDMYIIVAEAYPSSVHILLATYRDIYATLVSVLLLWRSFSLEGVHLLCSFITSYLLENWLA